MPTPEQIIQAGRKIVAEFEFDDTQNLLDAGLLLYSPGQKRVLLKQYLPIDYLTRDKKGTCFKLTKLALDGLRERFPSGIDIQAAGGYDPRFFKRTKKGHIFHFFAAAYLLRQPTIIIDGSFKFVGYLQGSGYEIEQHTVPSFGRKDNDLMLTDQSATPLILETEDGQEYIDSFGIIFEGQELQVMIERRYESGESENIYVCKKDIKVGTTTIQDPTNPLEEKVKQLTETATEVVTIGQLGW